MTARPPSQRIDQAKRLAKLNAPPQPKKVAAPVQVTEVASPECNPWDWETDHKWRKQVSSRGGEFKEFFVQADHVFWQPGRRRPYFDQIEPDDIQLAWPYHGCGVFNIEGGIRGLGIVRMVRFDINLQKSTLLVEWVYNVQEARDRIKNANPLNAGVLRAKLNKMNSQRDLLLSNHLDIVSSGSLLGPAIEPVDELFLCVTHWLDCQEWQILPIPPRDLNDLVRPMRWDKETKKLGAMMRPIEFYSKYGKYAQPKGLLTDDIHPIVQNPCLLLLNFLQDGDELQALLDLAEKAKVLMHKKDEAEHRLEEAQNRRAQILKALGPTPAFAPEPDFGESDEIDSEEKDGEEEAVDDDEDQLDEDEEEDGEGEGEDEDVDMSGDELEYEDHNE